MYKVVELYDLKTEATAGNWNVVASAPHSSAAEKNKLSMCEFNLEPMQFMNGIHFCRVIWQLTCFLWEFVAIKTKTFIQTNSLSQTHMHHSM